MIGVTGINHITASIDIRELFIFSKNELSELSALLMSETNISEIVVLSTCNRTELYYYQDSKDISATDLKLRKLIHGYKKVDADYTEKFYSYSNKTAIKHLFSVTSGIDSLIFGEDQIVRQVKESYLNCTELALTDAILMRLFQKSFEASKRVRTETGIQNGTRSISYIAVEKCISYFGDLSDKTVLLIGAGETGKLSLLNLVKKGIRKLYIANRTGEKAEKLAEDYLGKSIKFDNFKEYLPKCDIVIAVTNSKNYLITKGDIIDSMDIRNGDSQVYIDLSVPRNIDPEANDIENTKILAIDDLQEIADENSNKRLNSKELAENIINEMTEEYYLWLKSRNLRPIINKITNSIQKMHKDELENYKKCFSDETIDAIDIYAGRLTQKYIRSFIKNLKEINANGNTDVVLAAIKDLFIFDSDK